MSTVVRSTMISRNVAWICSSVPRVDRRRGVVEHEDARIGEHRARDRDALALTAGERETALADDGVVAQGQLLHEVVGAGDPGRALDVGVGRVGAAVRDVGAHGVGEEEGVFEHDADLVADRVEGDVAHVGAVDADGAVLHVVEAGEQEADRRLARPGCADEGHRLARRHPQARSRAAPARSGGSRR